MLLSALGVGVGLGVGLGIASGQKWSGAGASLNSVTAEKLEQELLRQIVDGRETNVTFDQFPYYLRLVENSTGLYNRFCQKRLFESSVSVFCS